VEEDVLTMTATEQASRILLESMLADDGGGYPDRVSFIGNDVPNWESIAWRSISRKHCPTVIVDEDALEILLIPVDRPAVFAWIDRLRGRASVRMGWRQHDGAHAYELPVSLSRSRLAALEPTAIRRAA
jgi:hypothetical protein